MFRKLGIITSNILIKCHYLKIIDLYSIYWDSLNFFYDLNELPELHTQEKNPVAHMIILKTKTLNRKSVFCTLF